MKKRSTLKFLAMLLLLAQLFSLTAGITVFAADENETERDEVIDYTTEIPEDAELVSLPAPYARHNCSALGAVSMGGNNYDEGLVFKMGYTGISNGAQATAAINLDGKFSAVTFDACYVGGDERGATLIVYGDGVTLLETSLKCDDIPKTFALKTEGVKQLKFYYNSSAYDQTRYGIAAMKGIQIAELDTTVYGCDEFYAQPLFKNSGSSYTGEYNLGGKTYDSGISFRMGYVLGGSKSVSFNFKKQYEEMTFDVAKYLKDADSYCHPGYMTIEVDGEVVPEYDNVKITWDDLVMPVKLNLKDVSQVTIKFSNGAYDTIEICMVNIQLKSNGKAQGILLDAKAVSGTDDYTLTLDDKTPEFALNPRVYPSDAPRDYEMKIAEGGEFITVEDNVVTAIHGGTAKIVYTLPENKDVEVVCDITSKVTAHLWDEGEVTKAPTLKEKGEKLYKCTLCDKTKTEKLDKLVECEEHTWNDGEITKEPTYEKEGEALFTCTVCGKTETRAVEKLTCTEHEWQEGAVTKEPTYTEAGEKELVCINCGDTKTEPIDKLVCTEHEWEDGEMIKEPTYTEEGEKLYICAKCGETNTVPVDKLVCTEHKWDDGEVTKEPTYEAEGETLYTCENCGETKTEPVDQLVCKNHKWDDGKIIKEPTYIESGERLFTCTVCGSTLTEVLPQIEPENPFEDLNDNDWFYDSVLWAYTNGITGGIAANLFGPHESCTRGQVVTFLWAAAGKPEPTSDYNPFKDVTEADYFYKAVLWAVENEITKGVAEDMFGPAQACTRAQIVTFLYASHNKPEPNASASPFEDVADDAWYIKPVLWAVENEITSGVGEGMFGPENICTRCQIVTFLYKASMIEKQPEGPATPEEPMEPEQPEEPQTALVTDAYAEVIEGKYYTHCYHIPQINLPDDLAAGWNKAMYDTLYQTIKNTVLKPMEATGQPETDRMVYAWGQHGDLVSIVVREDETAYDWSTHTFYTVSTETGLQVVDSDIYAAYDMTEEDFYAAVKIVLAAVMAEEAEYYKNLLSPEEIQELIDKTLSDENLKAAKPFIAPNGKLSFMGGVYTPAGAGRYYHLWTLDGENITVTCEEH